MRLCDAVIYFSKKARRAKQATDTIEINDSTFVVFSAIIVHFDQTYSSISGFPIVSLRLCSKTPTTLGVAVAHHPDTQQVLTQDNLRESLNLPHGKNDT
jgi:hypothetical protein